MGISVVFFGVATGVGNPVAVLGLPWALDWQAQDWYQ